MNMGQSATFNLFGNIDSRVWYNPTEGTVSESQQSQEDIGVSTFEALDRGFATAQETHDQQVENCSRGPFAPQNPQDHPKNFPQLLYSRRVICEEKRWFPYDQLFSLVNEEAVYQELCRSLKDQKGKPAPSRFYNYDLRRIAQEICQPVDLPGQHQRSFKSSRRGIFAALCLMDRHDLNLLEEISAFLESGIKDSDLPLASDEGQHSAGCFELSRVVDPSQEPRISRDWHHSALDLFKVYQTWFISPFFDLSQKEVPFYDLTPTDVLPFIKEDPNMPRTSRGYHGTVRKVQIHPAHHNYRESANGSNPFFAVKELTPNEHRHVTSQNEVVGWINAVGTSDDQHLVRLLAVWHQKDTFSLMFPWADGGNLRDFWNTDPERTSVLAGWMLDQLLGISMGLKRIHRSGKTWIEKQVQTWGIHGDVKPENILWYPGDDDDDLGRLAICDFGFTRFHEEESRSAAQACGMTLTYRAPEFDTGSTCRASDMWSLGCVILEFLTWYLLGPKQVEEDFTTLRVKEENGNGREVQEDKFFVYQNASGPDDSPGARVKLCVHQWIHGLRATPRCSSLMRDLLDLVEQKLLVIDHERRTNSDQIVAALREMQDKRKCHGTAYHFYSAPSPTVEHSTRFVSGTERLKTPNAATDMAVDILAVGTWRSASNGYKAKSLELSNEEACADEQGQRTTQSNENEPLLGGSSPARRQSSLSVRPLEQQASLTAQLRNWFRTYLGSCWKTGGT